MLMSEALMNDCSAVWLDNKIDYLLSMIIWINAEVPTHLISKVS